MTVAAIVYGEATGIVRRLIVADSVKKLAGHYGSGESIIIVPSEQVVANGLPDDAAMAAMVEEKRGKPAEPARCIVIDDEAAEIETVIPADPVIDAIEGKTLYQHPEASPGWSVDENGEFVAPPPEEDEPEEGEPSDEGQS